MMEGRIRGCKDNLLSLFSYIGRQLNEVSALIGGKASTGEVGRLDQKVDFLYEKTEEMCFRVLLLEAPFAGDFLKVSSILKMITDLERIGDYCTDVEEELPRDHKRFHPLLSNMVEMVVTQFERAYESYVNGDIEKARSLVKEDDALDEAYLRLKKECEEGKGTYDALNSVLIGRYLERMGDHMVNIGEWVDYGLTGTHGIS